MVTKISQFLNTSFSTLSVDDTVNGAVSYPGTLIHTTTSTPATGIGVGLQFQTETSASNTETGMTVEAVTTDITAGSEDFDFVVKLMQNGAAAAERFRVTSAGAVSLTGALTAGSFSTSGTIAGASLAVTGSTAPANGVYLPAANTLGFSTASTQRLQIDSSGRIGIGNISPLSTLDVNGIASFRSATSTAGAATVSSLVSNTTVGVGGAVVNSYDLTVTGGALATTASSQVLLQNFYTTSTNADYLEITNTRNAAGGTDWTTSGYRLQAKVDSTWMGFVQFNNGGSTVNNSGGISFGTGTTTVGPNSITERMRIDANGNVAISLTSVTAGYKLDVGGSVRVAGGIVATGEITAYFSDQRLKSNITAITNAVDKVMAINGVYYNANDLAVEIAGEDKTVQRVGLLAQEVEAVLPHVVKAAPFDIGDNGVSKTGEHYKTLQYERIVPLLVEAIKEQQEQILALTKRVEQLENKNST